jgi:tyrosine-protein kinase Etk/Wzc
MEMFIRMDLEEKNQTAVNTIEFIDGQLVEIVDSLQQVEDAMQDFKVPIKLLTLAGKGNIYFPGWKDISPKRLNFQLKANITITLKIT